MRLSQECPTIIREEDRCANIAASDCPQWGVDSLYERLSSKAA